ncbi:hypothetical protein LXA43DRAFT_1095697 [Ganoderma leucocontextum]|nr:hypothetical protein LXA43DRAFT_1095697 [Ganoderma leucocontextum]
MVQQFRKVVTLQGLPPEALRRLCDTLIGTPAPSTFTQVRSPTEPDDHYVGLHTVLSLARTSRVLHEHAADALWDTIPAFGILVYTLPRDIWSCAKPVGARPTGPLELALKLERPLVDADLVRFNHYAHRVKRILLPAACTHFPPRTRSITFSPNILDAFGSRPYGRVLPNLRVLRSSPDLRHYADFYRSFSVLFGPTVQDVSTWCPYVDPTVPKVDEDHWKQMMTGLHAVAPNLCTLNLNADDQPLVSTLAPILSSVVATTSECLRAIQIGHMPINLNALRHLAALPFVVVLSAKLDDNITANELVLLLKPGKTCFPTLQEVHLAHSRDLFLLTLFVHLTQPALSRLKVVALKILEAPVPFHFITNFLDDVAEHEDAEHITVISLECHVDPQSPGPHVLTEDHLRPFFALRQLGCLHLHVKCDFDINNATLEKAAAAWPNIIVLALGPSPTAKMSKVTLEGLIPFAHGCPRLKMLALTIDPAVPMEAPVDLNGPYGSLLLHGPAVNVEYALYPISSCLDACPSFADQFCSTRSFSMIPNPAAVIPTHFQQKPLSKTQTSLEVLRLGRSPMGNPAAVGGFLSCFFPNLENIRGEWRPAEVLDAGEEGLDFSEEETREIIAEAECRMAWYRVVDNILPEIAHAREQERNARRAANVDAATSV